MNTPRVPQCDLPLYGRRVEGPGTSRLYGLGDVAHCTAHGLPEGASVPPALEPPSAATAQVPPRAGASEPGLSGPKGPILDTLTGTIRQTPERALLTPAGQRVFDAPGYPAQGAFDGTWTDPANVNVGSDEDPPSPAPGRAQVPLPLPEPWVDGSQLRLDVAYEPPAGSWVGTLGAYLDALGATWASVAAWSRSHGQDPRLVTFMERRAREVPVCGETWKVPVCTCGHHEDTRAVLIEGCDSRTCPRCAKLRANAYRRAGFSYVQAHPVKRVKGRVSRGYFLTTLTEEKPPTLTVDGLAASVRNVKHKGRDVYRQVTRFLPRKQNGTFGKYPGKCDDAGQVVGVEVGPSGNVHAHVLRYGAYHYSADVRAAAGDTWTKDTKVRQDEHGARGGVVEALKYATKSSTKPGRREYTHPALAVLFEVATYRMRLVEGYGTMRGLIRQGDDAYMEQRQGVVKDEAERTAELAPCPCCGRHDWHWENVSKPHGWTQPARPKPPPDP